MMGSSAAERKVSDEPNVRSSTTYRFFSDSLHRPLPFSVPTPISRVRCIPSRTPQAPGDPHDSDEKTPFPFTCLDDMHRIYDHVQTHNYSFNPNEQTDRQTDMNCIPKFSHIDIRLSNDPNRSSFKPGKYIFAFKYLTRQVGWGIETQGKYPTNAAPSSNDQIRDGWPVPIVKESELSHPHNVYTDQPWNIAWFSIRTVINPGPFTNISLYMDKGREEYGEWTKIYEFQGHPDNLFCHSVNF